MKNLRRLPLLAVLLFTAALVAAGCGGGDSADPEETLSKALSADGIGQLKSGTLDMEATIGISNGGDPAQEVKVNVSGPFAEDGSADFTATATGADPTTGAPIDFEGGLTTTADNAFITYNGTPYELGTDRYELLKENSPDQSALQGSGLKERFSLACEAGLGQAGAADTSACENIDPGSWVKLESDGTEEIGGVETDHFSGDVEIDKFFGDFMELFSAAAPQGAGGLPNGLLEQVPNFIESATVDLYVGQDDSIIRKGEFGLSANLFGTTLDFGAATEIGDVNEPQTISAPTGAKPIEELRGQLPPDARGAFDCFLKAKDIAAASACGSQAGASAVPGVSTAL